MTNPVQDVRYDRTLRVVMWLDAFFSVGIVAVGVVVSPVLAAVGVPRAAQLALGVTVIVTSVALAAFGAITAVLVSLRLRAGAYLLPVDLRVPLPRGMNPLRDAEQLMTPPDRHSSSVR